MKKLISLIVLLTTSPAWTDDTLFNPEYAGFDVNISGMDNSYNVLGIYVMPNEAVPLRSSAKITVTATMGETLSTSINDWTWIAPQKSGLYQLTITSSKNQKMTLNAFVMRPATEIKNNKLDEYRIGIYPSEVFRSLEEYKAPKGFIEVTPKNKNTLIAPHFTLGQFICKQTSVGPNKFVVLREELLIKLERILQEVNRQGIRTDSFFIMSGYRTPYYNKAIRNSQYSRHVFGGAADIYIDASPKDGNMDDLNKDGTVNRQDAAFLYDLVERLSRQENWDYIGGLGEYDANSAHGPFVHVDARGYRARWGKP